MINTIADYFQLRRTRLCVTGKSLNKKVYPGPTVRQLGLRDCLRTERLSFEGTAASQVFRSRDAIF